INEIEWNYSDPIPATKQARDMIDYIMDDGEINKWNTSFFYFLKFYLDLVIDELIESLFFSSKDDIVSVNSFGDFTNSIDDVNSFNEELNYIINIDLIREANIFPCPEDFDDVLRFRESKDIIRFREVTSNWISSLKEGNEKIIFKVQKDLIKANKQLKNLSKWKEYKNSQISFWVNSVGGHIPLLSNFLTLVYTADHFISKKIEDKNNWILINK
ncbi:MAG: hypothetical protein AAFY76_06860, partial [Cyanobacteria bacterium J06649_11]